MWRVVKDGTTFYAAAEKHFQNATKSDGIGTALSCRQNESLNATLGGIPFVTGMLCALSSLNSCEGVTQTVEMYVLGALIGSILPIPIEAVLDDIYGRMDESIDEFQGREDFQALIAIEEYAAIGTCTCTDSIVGFPRIPPGGIDFPPYRPAAASGSDMGSCPACRGQHKAHTCKKARKRKQRTVLLDKDPNAVSQFNAVSEFNLVSRSCLSFLSVILV